jgi:3-isopropylmalate/(R)-2-methylmalate dehydratase small subunit
LKNGLLAIVVPEAVHLSLLERAGESLVIDLEQQRIERQNGDVIPFAIDPFARECLLAGVDELGWLLARRSSIESWEAQHAWIA